MKEEKGISLALEFLLLKAGYLLAVVAALLLWGDPNLGQFSRVRQRWPREGGPTFGSHLATWDAAHYLYLSEVGYKAGVPSCAFYPLWPLAVRLSSALTGGSHLIAGLVLANVFSLVGFVLFFHMAVERFGRPTAKLSVLCLLAYPGSLFYQFIYSEGLFLLLVMLLWLALEHKRYGVAAAAAFLLPISRAVGLFCVLPILWDLMRREQPGWMIKLIGKRGWAKRDRARAEPSRVPAKTEDAYHDLSKAQPAGPQTSGARQREGRHLCGWGLLSAPVLGWGCYLALMWHWTGNPFEGFEAQKYWRVHSIWNLVNVPKFVIGLLSPSAWHEFNGSLLDRCVFILLLYCLPLIWRLDKGLFVWAWVLGVVPAMSGTFTSFTRFASCAFPMFIALGVFLGRPERRWLRMMTIVVFAVLHVVLLWRFVNFRWAG